MRLKAKLIAAFGGACAWCGSQAELEFAHLRETGLKGPSRGQSKRLLDVQRNPDAYKLLCRPCHCTFDGRTYRIERSEPIEETADDLLPVPGSWPEYPESA
jgi:hypothetical protein